MLTVVKSNNGARFATNVVPILFNIDDTILMGVIDIDDNKFNIIRMDDDTEIYNQKRRHFYLNKKFKSKNILDINKIENFFAKEVTNKQLAGILTGHKCKVFMSNGDKLKGRVSFNETPQIEKEKSPFHFSKISYITVSGDAGEIYENFIKLPNPQLK